MDALVSFRFLLSTGFFRAESYFITISNSQIHLEPQEGGRRIRIPREQLQSIMVYSDAREIEIVTSDEVFIGRLDNNCSLDMVMNTLSLAFDSQLEYRPH